MTNDKPQTTTDSSIGLEHTTDNREAEGSSPSRSTNSQTTPIRKMLKQYFALNDGGQKASAKEIGISQSSKPQTTKGDARVAQR